VKRDTER